MGFCEKPLLGERWVLKSLAAELWPAVRRKMKDESKFPVIQDNIQRQTFCLTIFFPLSCGLWYKTCLKVTCVTFGHPTESSVSYTRTLQCVDRRSWGSQSQSISQLTDWFVKLIFKMICREKIGHHLGNQNMIEPLMEFKCVPNRKLHLQQHIRWAAHNSPLSYPLLYKVFYWLRYFLGSVYGLIIFRTGDNSWLRLTAGWCLYELHLP